MTITHGMIDQIHALQSIIGAGNARRGFHEEGERLRASLHGAEASGAQGHILDDATAALRNYYMTKLMLVTTEVAEAAEELRVGRPATQVYYSGGVEPLGIGLDESMPYDARDCLRKPEGVPSEIADIVIRCFDFAAEADIPLAEIIAEKLAYNDTRGRLHGKKV